MNDAHCGASANASPCILGQLKGLNMARATPGGKGWPTGTTDIASDIRKIRAAMSQQEAEYNTIARQRIVADLVICFVNTGRATPDEALVKALRVMRESARL